MATVQGATKRVLLLTDSRGVHKPVGSTHRIYAERLAHTPGIDLVAYRCPFQWTTIPDLLGILDREGAENFDHVILHAGIVDHSPRGVKNMMENLIDPTEVTSEADAAKMLQARNFSGRKIVNRKRPVLEGIFSAKAVETYLSRPFAQQYEGEPTINLYSTEMMEQSLLPRLKAIKNLIFVGSNNFVPGWQGDYARPRPENIGLVEDYSRILCEGLDNVVNLHQWNSKQVQNFTCDNLHLVKEGSDWIYLRLLEAMSLRRRDYQANRSAPWPPANPTPWPLNAEAPADELGSIVMRQQNPLTPEDVAAVKARTGVGEGPLATLVVGLRFAEDEAFRRNNLKHLVKYLNQTYPDLFDILLLEQDEYARANLTEEEFPGCRTEFMYNPEAYNRGWCYNAACRHFTNSKVVGFLDTDVIPGENFLQCILDCFEDYDAISPNRSMFYASNEQTESFCETGNFSDFPLTEEDLKNPTTFAGGMLVVNRKAFLDLGGFEQYVGYGCEDRALDVTMLTLLPRDRIRMDSHAYFHQYHPISQGEREHFRGIYNHMAEHYGCEYTPGLKVTDYIHKNCRHAAAEKIRKLRDRRHPHIGDVDLYRENRQLTVSGFPGNLNWGIDLIQIGKREPVFPPEFDGTKPYNDSEELTGRFANAWAPAMNRAEAVDDTRQLQFFYNRYKGKRCFIIGNGPSLNEHDLSLLKGEYSFAVNSFYYKTRETGFTPTFFVVEDSSVITENQEEIVNYEAPFKFFPGIYQSLHPKKPGTYFFNLNRGFYDKFSPNYAIPRFSTDVSKVAYCGQSVTYLNLQLAYYMGFTEVYLIGMDFNYVIPESHSRQGDVLTSDTDDPNHFHKDYFGKGKTWKDPKLDRVLMNYQMARLIYGCGGRTIYNATKGGHLEEFPRVDYDGLFSPFGAPREPIDLTRPDPSWSKLKFPEPAPAAASPVTSKPTAKPTQPVARLPKPVGAAIYRLGTDGMETVNADMLTAQDRGLLLYSDPRRAVVYAMQSGQDGTTALAEWVRETGALMPVLRANRGRLIAVEREAAAANPQAYAEVIKAHRLNQKGSTLDAQPSPDPMLFTLADLLLTKTGDAVRLLAELRASSVLSGDGENDVSVSQAVARYHDIHGKAARLAPMGADLKEKDQAVQLQAEQLAQLQATLETHLAAADQVRNEAEDLRGHTADLERRSHEMAEELDRIYRSKSWRVTEPLRGMRRALGRDN